MLALFHEQAFGNEQREVGVDVTGVFEPSVEPLLYELPDGVTVRTDDHAALHGRVIRELGTTNNIEIPTPEVLRLGRDLGWEIWNVGSGHELSG
jgi:hypothetical protein